MVWEDCSCNAIPELSSGLRKIALISFSQKEKKEKKSSSDLVNCTTTIAQPISGFWQCIGRRKREKNALGSFWNGVVNLSPEESIGSHLRDFFNDRPGIKTFQKPLLLFSKNSIAFLSQATTDCPATFQALCEGYCSTVGRPSGLFWVYSGRGRFGIFFEVLWTQVGGWEGLQKSSW